MPVEQLAEGSSLERLDAGQLSEGEGAMMPEPHTVESEFFLIRFTSFHPLPGEL